MLKFLILVTLVPTLCFSQTKDIKIHVTITGAPQGKKFYLFKAINFDSAICENEEVNFVYHKLSPDPDPIVITTGYKEPGWFCWTENEDMTISGSYSEQGLTGSTTSTGSVTQKEFEGLATLIKTDQANMKRLNKKAINEKDPLRKIVAQGSYDSVKTIYKQKIRSFVLANPGSSVSTFILMVSVSEAFTPDEVMELYSKLDKTQQQSEMGRRLVSTMQMLNQLEQQTRSMKRDN